MDRHAEVETRAEAKYRQLFDSIDQGFCVVEMLFDADGNPVDYVFLEVNAAFERQTGLVGVVGKRMRDLIPEHEDYWFEIFGRIALSGEPERFENEAAGVGRFYEVYAFRFGPAQARQVGILFNDIRERKQAEAHQRLLLAELDHRVKNVLAVVQSITRSTLRHQDPALADRLLGRFDALARSHRLLAAGRFEAASLRALVEESLGAHQGTAGERVRISGPPLAVRPKAAQSLSLAFHELATNAAKYGALSDGQGSVTIGWESEGALPDGRLLLTWEERMASPLPEKPAASGFGMRLVEAALVYELDGEVRLDFTESGLTARFALPLINLSDAPGGEPASFYPASSAARAVGGGLAGRRVLVAEDEPLIALDMSAILSEAGCEVVGPVPSLAAALKAVQAGGLDLAVLDVNLDGELVWPAAARLREEGVPLVLATGYSGVLEAPPDLADLPRLEKPVSGADLLACLTELLRKP